MKSIGCSSREPGFDCHTHIWNSSPRGSNTLFSGTVHTWCTHMQTKHTCISQILNFRLLLKMFTKLQRHYTCSCCWQQPARASQWLSTLARELSPEFLEASIYPTSLPHVPNHPCTTREEHTAGRSKPVRTLVEEGL